MLVEYLRDRKRNELLLFFATANLTRDDMLTVLIYLGEAFRDMLATKKSEASKMLFYLSTEKAEEDSYAIATETIMKLYTVVDTMAEELYYNPNMNVFAVRLACKLWESSC